MNCSEFRSWLDEGMPSEAEPAAREHGSRCDACGVSWRAALELDSLLSPGAEPAPPRFVERVMRRVSAWNRPSVRVELWPAISPLPWWAQVLAEPHAALARAGAFLGLDCHAIALAFWIVLAPALAWGSLHLYHWTERLLARSARA